jgi:hypothetical protein
MSLTFTFHIHFKDMRLVTSHVQCEQCGKEKCLCLYQKIIVTYLTWRQSLLTSLSLQRNWVADGIQSQDTVHRPKKVLNHAMAKALAGLSPWRPIFNFRIFPIGFFMGRVALGQFFLWVLWFSPDNIFTLMLHVHSFIHSFTTINKIQQDAQ